MKYQVASVQVAGETLLLHPLKAVYWQREDTLLIADLHLGKLGHFRRGGVGVPEHAAAVNWDKLQILLDDFNPSKVIFLGDLFHSDMTHEWRDLEIFMQQHGNVKFELIVGNHDIMPPFIYKQAGLKIYHEPLLMPPFLLSHDPLTEHDENQYNLAGHIHPGVAMGGKARQYLKLPCFFFCDKQGILPAFGEFTGLYVMKPRKNDQVYVIVRNEVFAV